MLNVEELENLLNSIHERIDKEVTVANEAGNNELKKVLMKYEISPYNWIKEDDCNVLLKYANRRILIVGKLAVRKNAIRGICKNLGMNYECIDFVDYDDATNYDYAKLRYSNKYSDVIFGAVPHKGMGVGNYTSIITMMEDNRKEFPNIIRATDSNHLKLTKHSMKWALTRTTIYKTKNIKKFR